MMTKRLNYKLILSHIVEVRSSISTFETKIINKRNVPCKQRRIPFTNEAGKASVRIKESNDRYQETTISISWSWTRKVALGNLRYCTTDLEWRVVFLRPSMNFNYEFVRRCKHVDTEEYISSAFVEWVEFVF